MRLLREKITKPTLPFEVRIRLVDDEDFLPWHECKLRKVHQDLNYFKRHYTPLYYNKDGTVVSCSWDMVKVSNYFEEYYTLYYDGYTHRAREIVLKPI